MTPYSLMWDWRVSRAGPIKPFYFPSCSLPYFLLLFSLSLLSFYAYGLVLWGWGLQTDRVLSLYPSLALPTFLIIIIIKWWSALLSVVFGLSSLLPPLVVCDGGLVSEVSDL